MQPLRCGLLCTLQAPQFARLERLRNTEQQAREKEQAASAEHASFCENSCNLASLQNTLPPGVSANGGLLNLNTIDVAPYPAANIADDNFTIKGKLLDLKLAHTSAQRVAKRAKADLSSAQTLSTISTEFFVVTIRELLRRLDVKKFPLVAEALDKLLDPTEREMLHSDRKMNTVLGCLAARTFESAFSGARGAELDPVLVYFAVSVHNRSAATYRVVRKQFPALPCPDIVVDRLKSGSVQSGISVVALAVLSIHMEGKPNYWAIGTLAIDEIAINAGVSVVKGELIGMSDPSVLGVAARMYRGEEIDDAAVEPTYSDVSGDIAESALQIMFQSVYGDFREVVSTIFFSRQQASKVIDFKLAVDEAIITLAAHGFEVHGNVFSDACNPCNNNLKALAGSIFAVTRTQTASSP